MAEKSFGVKDINLVGAAGTPTLESNGELYINASHVAIQTNTTISGVCTATNKLEIRVDDGTPARIDYYCEVSDSHYTRLQSAAHADYSGNVEVTLPVTSGDIIVGNSTSSIDNNINTTGIVTVGTFSGSGASLTSIPAGQLSGSLPAIDGSALTGINASVPANLTATTLNVSGVTTAANFRTNSTTGDGSDVGFAIKYRVSANGASAYRFAGPGLRNVGSNFDDPTIYVHRGFTYIFENSTGGSHPFRIQFTGTTIGVGTYLSGSQSGTQVFTIPMDAPASYEYQCTIHSSMKGTLSVV